MDSLNSTPPDNPGSGRSDNAYGGGPAIDGPPGVGLLDLTGRQIGRYLIGQRLGSGGVATVYRAFDQVQGQTVALKVLLPSADEKSYTRFRREALTAGALRHPNIVRILQVGTAPHGEVAYIAMELVEGESLADLLSQRRSLTAAEACALLAPIADALNFAHEAGIIHRDVKPSNILLRPASRGAPGAVVIESLEYPVIPLLSDFGIARALDAPELTSAGRTVGTPAYMAPEQAAGSRDVDGRADIYALGTVLYRCVTGRLPFVGTATQILHAHVYDPLLIESAQLAELPPDLVAVLRRSLAKRPEERYATPAQMAGALQLIAQREAIAPRTDVTTTLANITPVPFGRPGEPSETTILVPGHFPAGATGEPFATSAGASTGAAGGRVVGDAAAAPPNRPPTAPKLTAVSEPPPPRFRWGLWAAAIAMLILAAGTLGSVITLSRRNQALPATPTVAAVIELTRVRTPTPLPTSTPTRRATATPAPTFAENNPSEGTPTLDAPVFVLPTDTPQPEQATETPEPTETATPTETETPTPTETSPPTLSPTPSPTLTLIPSPTPTPTATAEPTLEPTPTNLPPTAVPPTATAIACIAPTDPAFAAFVGQLSDEAKAAFTCPNAAAENSQSRLLSFQNGYMLQIGDGSTLLVDMLGAGWKRVDANWQPEDPDPLPPDGPPDGLYLPTGIFGAAWQEGDLQDVLGFALSSEATSFAAVAQAFPGGMLVGDLDSGTLYTFLAEGER